MTNQTDPFLRSIGRKLKQLRQNAGLTQVQLAKTVELDYRHYQNLEAGHSNFKITTVKKLADFYNVTLASFFGNGFDGEGTANLHELLQEGKAERFNEGQLASVKERAMELEAGVLQIDRQGTIVFINPQAARMLNKERSEVEGRMSIWDMANDEASKEYVRLYHRFLMEFNPPPKPYFDDSANKSVNAPLVRAEWDYIYDGEGKIIGSIAVMHPMDASTQPFSEERLGNGLEAGTTIAGARMARGKVAAAEKASSH